MKKLHRRILNRLLAKLAGTLPGATTVRPWLYGLRGVQIRGRVFIGDDVYMENEYPESIVLEDGDQIGLRTIIIAHTRGDGQVVLEKDAFIGASCIITASDAQTLIAPERAKPFAQVTAPLKWRLALKRLGGDCGPLTPCHGSLINTFWHYKRVAILRNIRRLNMDSRSLTCV